MLTPIQVIAFNNTIILLPQYPKLYRTIIILRIPSRGPRYETTDGLRSPRKLKKMIVAKESHHPSPKSKGPRAPVVNAE